MSTSSATETVTSTAAIAATAAVVTASVIVLSREVLWRRWAKVLRSPLRSTLPRMAQEERKHLVYPPDLIPGARDVETPVSEHCSGDFERSYLSICNICV